MKTKPWTYSIILAVGSVASFFLPWFETTSRSSFGGQSFSQSLQASPAAALIFYVQWVALSVLSIILAYRKSRFAFLPSLLNFYPIFSAMGLFGRNNSIGYSFGGASVSASTDLAYGYWIFVITTILFFLATIDELFKSKATVAEHVIKSSPSLTEGFIPTRNFVQPKRSLEELRQAKDLLEFGAITQAEYDEIKRQALGTKLEPIKPQPMVTVVKQETKLPSIQIVPKNQTVVNSTENIKLKPRSEVKDATKSKINLHPKAKKKKYIIIGIILLVVAISSTALFLTSNDESHFDLIDDYQTNIESFSKKEIDLYNLSESGGTLTKYTSTDRDFIVYKVLLTGEAGSSQTTYWTDKKNHIIIVEENTYGGTEYNIDDGSVTNYYSFTKKGLVAYNKHREKITNPLNNLSDKRKKIINHFKDATNPSNNADRAGEKNEYNPINTKPDIADDSLFYAAQASNLLENGMTVNAKAGLVLRDKPDISGNKIVVVPYGERVAVIKDDGYVPIFFQTNEKSGYWQKVEYGDYIGYVFDGYLERV